MTYGLALALAGVISLGIVIFAFIKLIMAD